MYTWFYLILKILHALYSKLNNIKTVPCRSNITIIIHLFMSISQLGQFLLLMSNWAASFHQIGRKVAKRPDFLLLCPASVKPHLGQIQWAVLFCDIHWVLRMFLCCPLAQLGTPDDERKKELLTCTMQTFSFSYNMLSFITHRKNSMIVLLHTAKFNLPYHRRQC